MWPFTRNRRPDAPGISDETKTLVSRTACLEQRVEAQGRETRAVAREAQHIRSSNHFGPAVVAAFQTPRGTR